MKHGCTSRERGDNRRNVDWASTQCCYLDVTEMPQSVRGVLRHMGVCISHAVVGPVCKYSTLRYGLPANILYQGHNKEQRFSLLQGVPHCDDYCMCLSTVKVICRREPLKHVSLTIERIIWMPANTTIQADSPKGAQVPSRHPEQV